MVRIWLKTDMTLKSTEGKIEYRLQLVENGGVKKAARRVLYTRESNLHRAYLKGIKAALGRIENFNNGVEVYADNKQFILNMIMLKEYERRNYTRVDGKPLKNADLLRNVAYKAKRCEFYYRKW